MHSDLGTAIFFALSEMRRHTRSCDPGATSPDARASSGPHVRHVDSRLARSDGPGAEASMPRVWDAANHVEGGNTADPGDQTQETNLGSTASKRRRLKAVRRAGRGLSSRISLYDSHVVVQQTGLRTLRGGTGGWGACGSSRASLSDPLPPGLTLEMHEEFYGITGSTAEDLAAAMRRLDPRSAKSGLRGPPGRGLVGLSCRSQRARLPDSSGR